MLNRIRNPVQNHFPILEDSSSKGELPESPTRPLRIPGHRTPEEEHEFWNPLQVQNSSDEHADNKRSVSGGGSNKTIPDPPTPEQVHPVERFYLQLLQGHNFVRALHKASWYTEAIPPLALWHLNDTTWHLAQALRVLRNDPPYPLVDDPNRPLTFEEWLEHTSEGLQQLISVTNLGSPDIHIIALRFHNLIAARHLVNEWTMYIPPHYHAHGN